MRCAIINNNIVQEVRTVLQEEFDQGIANKNQLVISVEGLFPEPSTGWTWDGKAMHNSISSTKISKLALRQRFTFSELVAIKAASATNPMLAVLLDNLSVATFIDLSLTSFRQGIGLLVPMYITPERAAQIMNTPPTYDELYKGIE